MLCNIGASDTGGQSLEEKMSTKNKYAANCLCAREDRVHVLGHIGSLKSCPYPLSSPYCSSTAAELLAGGGILGEEGGRAALAHRPAPAGRHGHPDCHAAGPRRRCLACVRAPGPGLRLCLGASRTPALLACRHSAGHSSCSRCPVRSSSSAFVPLLTLDRPGG